MLPGHLGVGLFTTLHTMPGKERVPSRRPFLPKRKHLKSGSLVISSYKWKTFLLKISNSLLLTIDTKTRLPNSVKKTTQKTGLERDEQCETWEKRTQKHLQEENAGCFLYYVKNMRENG